MSKKLTIGVSMIVRNEEEMLPRALESVKEADIISITDTGSEDKTVEIAKKYTDDIHYFKWVDHFGKARQYAKEKCKADWIVTVDADEVLKTDFKKVRETIEKADKEGHVFVNVDVKSESGSGQNKFPRIYKNIPEITWHGPAHNYLHYNGKAVGKAYPSDIVIEYGYSPAHKADPDRTLRILKKAVEENPELTRERFYLAREYFYRKNWEKCMEHLDEYIPRSRFLGERNDAWLVRAYCLSGLKRYNEAVDSAWQALKYNANFKEALLFIANHMDSVNKERWKSFAELADNTNVVFIREIK
jgi:glycosyltransferase involved in cell wall biosynthesis